MTVLTIAEANLEEARRSLKHAEERVERLKAAQNSNPSVLTEDDVTVEAMPSGGVRITVDCKDSDSLGIVEFKQRGGSFSARLGLRGNFDAQRRPMRWVTTHLHAPRISVSVREGRRIAAIQRRSIIDGATRR